MMSSVARFLNNVRRKNTYCSTSAKCCANTTAGMPQVQNSSSEGKEPMTKEEWWDYHPCVHFKYGAVTHVEKFKISNENEAEKRIFYYMICLVLFF